MKKDGTVDVESGRCRRCGDGFPAALDPGDYEGICPACLAGLATEPDPVPSTLDPLAQAAKDPPPLKRGATFRGLEVLELVGQGGMGVVYKARQIELGRIVALKILSPRLASDPEFARRFIREAQALATLDHPNVVRVHDVGREGDLCFLVMEYVDGATLRELLVQRRLGPELALRLVPQLCAALDYAHSRGVIHRDIKPENILVSASGAAKIADFGLAKIVSADALAVSTLTQTDVVMGTVNYMAPEQREGRRDTDHRADIYSLGVVFYELLTGELPVGRFEPPSRRSAVDVRLDEVVLRALEKDPQKRYQRAGELGQDVERFSGAVPAAPADCPILDLGADRRLGVAPGRRLAVRAVACPVTVRGWDRPEIGLRIDGDYQFDAQASTPLLQSQVDTRSLVVHLPAGADLELTVDEAAAKLLDVRGQVAVRIADGALHVAGHDGPLRVLAGRGKVEVDGLRSEYVEIRAREGAVAVRGLLLSRGRGQIEAESGAVEIEASPGSSFRYYLESRSGAVDGPASGHVGDGAGWLTVRAGAGNVRFRGAALPPLAWSGFVRRLTAADVEKIGVFAIVNLALFLFFGSVAGTVAPAVVVAVFWGMSLGLQLWKGFIRGTPGRSLTEAVPSVVRAAMNLVPTPAPGPPPPPRPRTSKLAVLSFLVGILAALSTAGGGVALLVEGSTAVALSEGDAEIARILAFSCGAAAFALGALALFLGGAAARHVREGGAALRGRGFGRAAFLLGIASLAVVLGGFRTRLAERQRDASDVRNAFGAFVERLREEKLDEARELLVPGAAGPTSGAELGALSKAIRGLPPDSSSVAESCRVVLGAGGMTASVSGYRVPGLRGMWSYGRVRFVQQDGLWKIVDVTDFARTEGGRR